MFEIDPSSTFYGWKAHAIGRGAPESLKLLRKNWKEGLNEEDAIKLGLLALKAGEKGLKISEVELGVINSKGYEKYHGAEGLKFIKKFW